MHAVLPLVYQAIQRHAADIIPKACLAEFKQQNRHVVAQNLYMSAELLRIATLLQEKGINVLSFKGPVLSSLAYGDIALRQYVDLDILIKKQDIVSAIAFLTEDGYRSDITLPKGVNSAFYYCVNVIGYGKNFTLMFTGNYYLKTMRLIGRRKVSGGTLIQLRLKVSLFQRCRIKIIYCIFVFMGLNTCSKGSSGYVILIA